MHATDPRNLQPEVPKAMRDAAEHIRRQPPSTYDQQEVDCLIDTLNAPYPERVRKQVRDITTDDSLPAEAKSAALAELVDRLALTPAPDPQPLPLVETEDINLICWLAIVPDGDTAEEPLT